MLGSRAALRLEDPLTGETIEALCPPDEFEPLPEPPPTLDRRSPDCLADRAGDSSLPTMLGLARQ